MGIKFSNNVTWYKMKMTGNIPITNKYNTSSILKSTFQIELSESITRYHLFIHLHFFQGQRKKKGPMKGTGALL